MESTPRAGAQVKNWIALLGRRDVPTDGVEDYCSFLGAALARHGINLHQVRVSWDEQGWRRALRQLWSESRDWRGRWVLLEYTALAWSRRGFPITALAVLGILRVRGSRTATVFHDNVAFPGPRLRDRVRNRIQTWTMRGLLRYSAQSVLTVPPASVPWIGAGRPQATFIPIGANIPEDRGKRTFDAAQTPKVIAVFGVTYGESRAQEVVDIAEVIKRVRQHVGEVRLEVFGRGAEDARQLLERAIDGSGVDLQIRGVIPAAEITHALTSAHAMLCVRGLTTSRRGSAIAGVACGLPTVGYGDPGSDPAIDSTGIILAPWRDRNALSDSLVRLLTDAGLWQKLHERNILAQAKYFSWEVIADRLLNSLAASKERS
jgi:glycosyltransferase involved in cell wall biosynthesis